LILRNIIKIAAIRCHSLKLKCAEFAFGCRFAPDTAGKAYRSSFKMRQPFSLPSPMPPEPLAGFKGATSKGRGGHRRGRGGRGRRGEEKGRKGKKRAKGRGERRVASS